MRIIDRDMNREVLELYLLGEVDDSAIEDFLLHDILSFRSTIHVRADQYERFDLDWLTPTECRQMFRFEKDYLIMLRRAVGIPDVVLAYPRYEVSGKAIVIAVTSFCALEVTIERNTLDRI